jgi:hypothetical protein
LLKDQSLLLTGGGAEDIWSDHEKLWLIRRVLVKNSGQKRVVCQKCNPIVKNVSNSLGRLLKRDMMLSISDAL